ncbi:OmpW/AlkL family protein [Paenirhodobacter enshiensis]|uniref:Membrane protein n=1 Tax=Paenirhodobacter enshiensis TaxID=1105367 RepID=A0A086XYT2_9RHOB|nr:OmpW family outer membrane protein [Paenirhodobacter enshiensis]KFI27182.1 membrane protein [Paenirhodobacter enshiensis]
MRNLILAAIAGLSLIPGAVAAQDAGTFTLGIGLGNVVPKDNNGTLAGVFKSSVGENVQPTFTLEYFVYRNVGIEVLAATPFKHNVRLNGAKAAEVTELPPTVSLQYHFDNGQQIVPFVGAGVNYTAVLKEKEVGPLAGTDLDLSNSWGLAAHAGVDVKVNETNAVRFDVRYIDINLDARLNGADIGTAKVDPMVWGVSWIHRF